MHFIVCLHNAMCNFHIAEKLVMVFTHAWCLGTTSVEKPLPTFQLYGSNITTIFHISDLGKPTSAGPGIIFMSLWRFYEYQIYGEISLFPKVSLVASLLERQSSHLVHVSSNPVLAKNIFFNF
jgi:hypothetical protein